jgi:hypothetical protein
MKSDPFEEARHTVINALHVLSLTYELLATAPPVMIGDTVRDAREAMQRLQIAHENYLRACKARNDDRPRK